MKTNINIHDRTQDSSRWDNNGKACNQTPRPLHRNVEYLIDLKDGYSNIHLCWLNQSSKVCLHTINPIRLSDYRSTLFAYLQNTANQLALFRTELEANCIWRCWPSYSSIAITQTVPCISSPRSSNHFLKFLVGIFGKSTYYSEMHS